MAGNKFDRKMRFLALFPYGYCSEKATNIDGMNNPYAGLLILGNDPDEVITQCKQYRQRTLYRSRDLVKKGYVKDCKIACGTPSEEKSFRALTAAGLAVLVEVLDEVTVDGDEDAVGTATHSRKIAGNHFHSTSWASHELQESLFWYGHSEFEADQQELFCLVSESVMAARVTPLTLAIGLAEGVKINLAKYSQHQRLNIWRFSHVQAMFQANQHLTYMDRRPYDTGFAIDGIVDEETFRAYIAKHGITPAAFTYYALTSWYRHNPGYYRFAQQYPLTTAEVQKGLLSTPAFYASFELPYAQKDTAILLNGARGNRQVVNAIHIGLAAGRNVNYACYHTANPGDFKWLPKRELRTKQLLENSIEQMKLQNPLIAYKDTVDFAIYFCYSDHQFLSFFSHIKKKHIQYKKIKPTTDKPFVSIHVVPINDSGAVLLWNLMESSPLETENQIRNQLLERDDGYAFRPEYYYPLTYQGKRVFLGHTMDIAKISHALEDHMDGFDFYIACYPEQVAWYRQLFPGKTFL